jgi:hypothetical protein
MIGDWVECTYWTPSKQLKVAEIRRIMDDETKIGVYSDDLILIFRQTEVKPIPLTAEILEKNLATEPQIAWCVGWNKKDDIHVEIKRDDLNAAFYGVIDFVHQLQHALRLCGIEKEIVL